MYSYIRLCFYKNNKKTMALNDIKPPFYFISQRINNDNSEPLIVAIVQSCHGYADGSNTRLSKKIFVVHFPRLHLTPLLTQVRNLIHMRIYLRHTHFVCSTTLKTSNKILSTTIYTRQKTYRIWQKRKNVA